MIGVVYYQDDPEQNIFRKVYPQSGDPDDILDDPKWLTDNTDPVRLAVMLKVEADDPRALCDMTGAA